MLQPLTGLVLCGGNSSRMKEDKSLLRYHQLPQRYHLYQQLQSFCATVFLSCNSMQTSNIPSAYQYMVDAVEFKDHGPMSALMTAVHQFPDNNFLVIGCDYPSLNERDIQQLIDHRNVSANAVSFYNRTSDRYESLLAIYENSIRKNIMEHYKSGRFSLQKILKETAAIKVALREGLRSVDTPEAYFSFDKAIKIN